MKILQLRFKNLNSLVGEWMIDLTHPAFTADGIFAITGPTGAGKTTILDAICLALYGRTPRLNRISKSGNEIMSRQTGDCFAEVTFETQAGRFRCHWSQHRARKKPAGELQPPRHEIANADSGEIFETRIKGVADQIETATGMDFDRFTRSMLLAQGGFAAFLQAPPDERAPILEQITGTEIYSRISVRVHERRSQERKQLEIMLGELAGMQPLSPEEEQQLAESLEQKSRRETELTQLVTRKQEAISWIEGIARLEAELKALDRAKSELQARALAFEPEQQRLRLATQALELSADYATLTAMRREQEAELTLLNRCRTDVPGRSQAARQAEEAMKSAVELFEARKREQQILLPIIRKAGGLDLKIAEKDAPIKAARDAIGERAAALELLRTGQKRDTEELAGHRSALEELRALLAESRADEGLVEQLAGVRSRFEALKALSGQLAGKGEETTLAETGLRQAVNAWQEQSSRLEEERRGLERLRETLETKQAAYREILQGKELAEWRKILAALTERKELIARTADAVDSLAGSRREICRLENRQTGLRQEETLLSARLASRSEQETAGEKELGLLETQLTLLKRIEDLEDARNQLQDGHPCPLCGATEHPFAAGNIPPLEGTQQRLATLRGELKSLTAEISELRVDLARLHKDLEQTSSSLKEQGERMVQAGRVIGENCAALESETALSASDPELSGKLGELREENHGRIVRVNGILESAEGIEKEMLCLRDSGEKAREAAAKRELEVQQAAHNRASVERTLERLRREAAECRNQLDKLRDTLEQDLGVYGVSGLSIDTIDTVHKRLSQRRDQWVSRNDQKIERERKVDALEIQVHHRDGQISEAEAFIARQQGAVTTLLGERDALGAERRELLGERKTDEEEKRLGEAIESDGRELDEARQISTAASQELAQLLLRIHQLQQTITARDLQVRSANEEFLTRLTEAGFGDEESYCAASLPENQRRQLALLSQKLLDEKNELASKEGEKSRLLEAEQRRSLTAEPLEDIQGALAGLSAEQRDLQREIGGISQRLADNLSLKQRQQERLQGIEAQKRECARWDLLHELIGSADGKKYRNFAQGLTFEIMIGHANRQLRKMTDRYLLLHDDSQPLELNVIDNYQAGEVRSTKNLSGGESFIVSLALSLGLSGMASRNVRVDSLFLDEGFGTLDEDALETALETLSGLQREGKLIGIISHVTALKERIATRIQVEAGSAGRGSLSGPGCQRIA